jgi:ketosteroid isomerase-like protein
MMQKNNLGELVEAYLVAFEARDLARCIDFFDHDASIYFLRDIYRGKEAIDRWHKDRFDIDLRFIGLKGMTIEENEVRMRGSIVSKRIRAWPARSLSVIVNISFEQGKIKKVKFGLGAIQAG